MPKKVTIIAAALSKIINDPKLAQIKVIDDKTLKWKTLAVCKNDPKSVLAKLKKLSKKHDNLWIFSEKLEE